MSDERIEAVAQFADHGTLLTADMRRAWAERVIATLDRVRDARGDDEAVRSADTFIGTRMGGGERPDWQFDDRCDRPPAGWECSRERGIDCPNADSACCECGHADESHRDGVCAIAGCLCIDFTSAPSPSRDGTVAVEDHEADWWYWRCTHCGRVQSYRPPKAGPGAPMCDYGHHSQPMERAYLSRVSPSRDGTVAVEDVREKLDEMDVHDGTGDRFEAGYVMAINELREFLAEYREEKKT